MTFKEDFDWMILAIQTLMTAQMGGQDASDSGNNLFSFRKKSDPLGGCSRADEITGEFLERMWVKFQLDYIINC